jgi:NTP pyrophosphatase (non-canonical NTP hydrolase)
MVADPMGEIAKMIRSWHPELSTEQRITHQMLCLAEEVGEVAEQWEALNMFKMHQELADVVIVCNVTSLFLSGTLALPVDYRPAAAGRGNTSHRLNTLHIKSARTIKAWRKLSGARARQSPETVTLATFANLLRHTANAAYELSPRGVLPLQSVAASVLDRGRGLSPAEMSGSV